MSVAARPTRTRPRSSSTATRSRSTRPGHRRGRLPARAEPRRARPAAGADRLGRRAVRVALAIKQVLAEVDDTPTLVFDEVDTGIGGRSADPVGRSLWTLAREHQVLCVTHLPQIAAHADAHFRIAKRERDGRTVTEIERLDREERIVELAQMLGGAAGGARGVGPRAARPRRGMARWPPARRVASDGPTAACGPRRRDRGLPHVPPRRARPGPGDDPRRTGPTSPTSRRRAARPRDWADGPEAAQRYLAARARRGRPGDPGLAPTSLRRRAAAIRGFYRFAYGEGLIGVDVAAHLDLPRQPRLLPETLTVDEVDRLLEAAGERRPTSSTDEGAARPGAPRAALRGRPPDQRGARPRPRGPVARRRRSSG